MHERIAIGKNPGNTRGAEQTFGRCLEDGLYQGLVCLQHRLGKLFKIIKRARQENKVEMFVSKSNKHYTVSPVQFYSLHLPYVQCLSFVYFF